jgi:hypothetical protein
VGPGQFPPTGGDLTDGVGSLLLILIGGLILALAAGGYGAYQVEKGRRASRG